MWACPTSVGRDRFGANIDNSDAPEVADCARRGIDRHADRLLKNETRPVYDSGRNRCNVLARLVMERLQFDYTPAKKI